MTPTSADQTVDTGGEPAATAARGPEAPRRAGGRANDIRRSSIANGGTGSGKDGARNHRAGGHTRESGDGSGKSGRNNSSNNGHSNSGRSNRRRRDRKAEEQEDKAGNHNGNDGGSQPDDARGSDRERQEQQSNKRSGNKSRTKKVNYEPHDSHSSCLQQYASNDATIVQGKLRVMPSKNGVSFITCDQGSLSKGVLIKDVKDRNRALDGDFVFVELYP